MNTVLVKAEYDLSQTDIGHFTLFSLNKNNLIRVVFWLFSFFAFVIIPLGILGTILYGNLKEDWWSILFDLSYIAVFAGYLIYLRYFTQRKKYDPKLNKNIPHETFLFYQDRMLNITASHEEKSETVYQYSGLVEVFETKRYFYLFESKLSAFIIPKKAISIGSTDQLKSLLKTHFGKRYKRR